MKSKLYEILNSKHSSSLKEKGMINKARVKSGFKKEHSGFIISLEVMLSLLIFTQFSNYTMYSIGVMNSERYISSILTSTASQASRWGGNNTKAFKNNTGSAISIKDIAASQLATILPNYEANITVTPETVSPSNNLITVTITYKYPSIWQTYSFYDMSTGVKSSQISQPTEYRTRTKSITMPSVMKAGKLL